MRVGTVANLKQTSRRGRGRYCRQLIKSAMCAVLPARLFITRGTGRTGGVCLTFDDGPHPHNTPRLLDVLGRHEVRATFFLIGRKAQAHPCLVRRMVAEGHAVGHHTFNHTAPESQSATDLIDEVRRTNALLRDIVGLESTLFRPPWGRLTAWKLWKLWLAGQTVVLWNADPKDGERASAAQVRQWFADKPLQSGDILLMHDDQPLAAEVLGDVIAEGKTRGLDFVTPEDWLPSGRR